MAKIFLILTIILTGAAAFFGFQTYSKMGDVQATVKKTQTEKADAVAKLQKAGDDLKTAKTQLATAEEKATAAATESAASKEAATKATGDLAALQTKYDAQTADLEKAKTDLAAAIAKAGGPQVAGAPAVDDAALKEAKAQLQEAQTLTTTLQAKLKEDDDKIATLSKQVAGVEMKKRMPGLEGEVMAVNQGWNFVVVSIGDRQGATANAQLIVKRGDSMIGKVKITSVEPSTSIADIVPDSVAKGQRVMPGDRVIFPVQ